jgi:phosphate transport system substrate-binding protein
MNARPLRPGLIVTIATLLALQAAPSAATTPNEIDISAQAVFAPLMRQIATAYAAPNPGTPVVLREGSYADNLRDLDMERSDIAIVDRAPGGTNYVDHPLAIVPYALIADPKAGATSLTAAQVGGVFAGRITNWSQVGGADLPIVPIVRPGQSGTTALFAFLFGVTTVTGLTVDNTSSAVVNAVRTQSGAIGYVGVPYAKLDGVSVLGIDGAPPSAEAMAAGRYRFYTTIHAVTAGPPSPLLSRFLSFAESRRELLHAAGLFTIFETKRS